MKYGIWFLNDANNFDSEVIRMLMAEILLVHTTDWGSIWTYMTAKPATGYTSDREIHQTAIPYSGLD